MGIREIITLLLGCSRCVLCGSLDGDSLLLGICRSCLLDLEGECFFRRDSDRFCSRCGMKLLTETGLCTECRREDGTVRNHTLFAYRGIPRELIGIYKFQGDKRLARLFSRLIDTTLDRGGWRDYTLVPVPPSRRKIFRTGWDQVDLIVKDLTRSGWDRADILGKRGGVSQKKLNRSERQKAISGRFFHRFPGKPVPEKVLLIDDVYTTGATLRECYRILEEAGAEDIRSLTIARD